MRVYYHPSVGEYARYDSFEIDQAVLAGVPSGIVAGIAGMALKRASNEVALASLVGGGLMAGVFGAFYPKKILSWFNPPPFDAPLRYPRQIPKTVVPSFIGDSGQVLNLLMHHGAGDVVRDYSSYGNHGKIYGATWLDGSWGWCLDFNPTPRNVRVEIPDSPSLHLPNVFTIEFWYNLRSNNDGINADGWPRPITKPGSFDPYIRGNVIYFRVYSGGALTATAAYVTSSFGTWYHLILEAEAGGRMRIYRNGSLIADGAAPASFDITTKPLYIGNNMESETTGRGWNGQIAMVRIYNRKLSDAEKKQHFNSTRAIFGV